MIQLNETNNVLSIEDRPVGHWIGSVVILIVAALMFVGLFSSPPETVAGWVYRGAMFGICLFFAISMARKPFRRTLIDRNLRKVTILSVSILGRRFRELRFEDIDGGAILGIRLEGTRDEEHFIELLLKDEKPIELSAPENSSIPVITVVDRINEYLGMKLEDGDFRLQPLDLD